jgi:hypothetical protein
MAILRYEPFSETTTALDIFDAVNGTITISSASARFSGGNAQGASFPQNGWGEMNFPANPGPTIFMTFAMKLGAIPSASNRAMFHLRDSPTVQCSLGVDPVGRPQFYRGTAVSGTAIGSPGALVIGTGWHRYEAKIKLDATVGTVELRVDGSGTALITASGLNTKITANAFMNIIRMGDADQQGLSGAAATLFSDVIIYTDAGAVPNAFLGDRKLLTSKPNGAGASTQFTPSTGSNFQCVDDIPPNDDTDYVSDNTATHKDFYDVENQTFTGNADFVGQIYRARKDDASVHTMRGNFSSSGNVANGGTNTLSSSYKFYGRDEVLVNDPNTSSPFDQTGFNALQIGPEVVS